MTVHWTLGVQYVLMQHLPLLKAWCLPSISTLCTASLFRAKLSLESMLFTGRLWDHHWACDGGPNELSMGLSKGCNLVSRRSHLWDLVAPSSGCRIFQALPYNASSRPSAWLLVSRELLQNKGSKVPPEASKGYKLRFEDCVTGICLASKMVLGADSCVLLVSMQVFAEMWCDLYCKTYSSSASRNWQLLVDMSQLCLNYYWWTP